MRNKTKINLKNITFIFVIMLQFICISESFASTGTAMAVPLKAVNDLISGDISKIIAAISFGFALIGCVVKFNVHAIATCFGVALTAGAGPTVVQALVTATF